MWRAFPFRRFVRLVIAGSLIGALYSGSRCGTPQTGGAVGASMAAALRGVELFVLRRNAGGLIHPLPFLAYLGLRIALYLAIVALANYAVDWLLFGQFMPVSSADLLFSLTLVVGFNLLFSVNDLLGPGTLFAFAQGATTRRAPKSGRSSSST